MQKDLENIRKTVENAKELSDAEKEKLLQSIKAIDKELTILEFKLERTEKVKRTTSVLLEETIDELEKKRQDIEKQNRELEIEAALERVRSRSGAMQKSDELANVIVLLDAELHKLGVNQSNSVLMTDWDIDNLEAGANLWLGVAGQEYLHKYHVPFSEDQQIDANYLKARKKNNTFYTESYSKEEKDDYFRYHFKNGELGQIPEDRQKFMLNSKGYSRAVVSLKNSGLFVQRYNDEPFTAEQLKIIERFGNVFEQTYTRFIDLQKVEVQAREAQVEASLERVRAKAMAMHSSEDISDATAIVFNELTRLGIKMIRAGILILNEKYPVAEVWSTRLSPKDKQVTEIVTGNLNFEIHPMLQSGYRAWKEKKDYTTYELTGVEIREYYELLAKQPGYHFPKTEKYPERQIVNSFFHNEVDIFVYTEEELTEEEKQVLHRFSKVFSHTYRRYQDLIKAEEQAREAKIEASLERVRAKAMAMRSSKDISGATAVVFDELSRLGIQMERCGIVIIKKETPIMEVWTTPLSAQNHKVVEVLTGHLDSRIHPLLRGVYKGWKTGKKYFGYELKGEEVRNYYETLAKVPDYRFPQIDNHTDRQINNSFYFKDGQIFAFTKDHLSEKEKDIFYRFTNVFSLTYRRYVDILKAEAQAREAVKQASLDRVRGEIASMRTSEDLKRITPVIWHELQALEVPFIRCGVFIIDEVTEKVQVFLTTPEGKALGALNLAFDANDLSTNAVNYWRRKAVYKEHWDKQGFINWTKSMMELGQVQNVETYQGSAKPPESLHLHFVPFTQGMLYVGDVTPLSDEKIELVKTLAEAFSIAYARYEDFKTLEEAKNKIELTLNELKAAQTQLIQSEKMASLGELTAGIAHEIQNPLNFVNNFSELSTELLDELKEEIKNGNVDEVNAITTDVVQNLEKILHHGRRAEEIVKGMLLHSRGSSGQKELTDINALADEYLRLSFHGFRAKDKSFNADFKLEADENLPEIEVVPQDIGRVLLNLLNNAFQAVNEKAKSPPLQEGTDETQKEYKPQVIVKTSFIQPSGGPRGVKITVQDNGMGIPDSIKDKIFQPFFTTKPTGQGTGLGLSLSYDIVKAHGGTINVHSTENKGTGFIIQLPIS